MNDSNLDYQSRTRTTLLMTVVLVAMSAVGSTQAAQNAEALKAFDELFGKAYRGVATTRSTADDAKLAAVLISHAKETGSADAFSILLYERSYELGSKHTSGFRTATDALQELAAMVPRRQIEMQEKLLRLYEIVFRTSRGTTDAAKTRHERAGNATVELMMEIADAKARRADYLDASQMLTKAYQVGRVVKSPSLPVIKEKLAKVKPMALVSRKINTATKALERDPKDKEAAEKLAELFIVELDRPVTAKRYAARFYTKDQMNLLQWAGQPVDSLKADQSLKLATWYSKLAEDASSSGAVNMLVRAQVYYEQYLSSKPDDTSAKLGLTKVQLTFGKYKVERNEAEQLVQSRRNRLGITVAAATPRTTTQPQPKPVNPTPKPDTPDTKPTPVTPKPTPNNPTTKPVTPTTTNPDTGVDMSFYEDDVESEFAERKLDEAYWKNRASIFD